MAIFCGLGAAPAQARSPSTAEIAGYLSWLISVPAGAIHLSFAVSDLSQRYQPDKGVARAEVGLSAVGLLFGGLTTVAGAAAAIEGQPVALANGLAVTLSSIALLGHGIWALSLPDAVADPRVGVGAAALRTMPRRVPLFMLSTTF